MCSNCALNSCAQIETKEYAEPIITQVSDKVS